MSIAISGAMVLNSELLTYFGTYHGRILPVKNLEPVSSRSFRPPDAIVGGMSTTTCMTLSSTFVVRSTFPFFPARRRCRFLASITDNAADDP
jgi:hypothetical protein